MKDGIYTDLSITDYHANKTHVSATGIKYAKRSLKEFEWFITGKMKSEAKSQFGFGNAFELALLDKSGFEKNVAILQTESWVQMALDEKPELKVPKSSAKYKAEESKFTSQHEGKYIINDVGKESFETIEGMLTSCYQDAVIQKLISGVEYQLSAFWTDPASGLRLKTRPDICKRKNNVIVNLKTAVDGSPKAFSKDLANYDYPLQACIEIQGCIESGIMASVDNYFWLVVEKTEPYNATLYEFDQGDIRANMDEYEYLTNKIKQAQDKNLWPGYTDRADNPHGILTAQIPLYYKLNF